jgi:hypothetical protein
LADRKIDSKTRQVLASLRRMVADGSTFAACSQRLKRPLRTLYDLARRHGIARRPAKLSPEKDRAIRRRLARGRGWRQTMRETGCGSSSIARRKKAAAYHAALREQLAVVALPTSAWRCPGCGATLKLDRCLKCQTVRPRSRPTKGRTAERPSGRA